MISKENKFVKLQTIKEEKEEKEEILDEKPAETKWKRSDALAKAQKKYYEANKEKLVKDQMKYNYNYVRQKFKCACGDEIKISAKYLHLRSERHIRRMKYLAEGIDPNLRKCDTKYACECGSKIFHRNKKQHEKSKKHQDYLKENLLEIPNNISLEIKEIKENEDKPEELFIHYHNGVRVI